MSTCLDIITDALIMGRVLGIGKEPKAAETARGLRALQSMYDEWRTGGLFGELEDVYLDEDDTAEEGKRYRLAAGITLTAATADYLDVTSTTREPRDLSLYEVVTSGAVQTARLYDRTAWVDMLGLELTDVAPLSGRNSDGLAACLVTSGGFLAAFGADPPAPLIALARHFRRNIIGKQGSTRDKSGADYF